MKTQLPDDLKQALEIVLDYLWDDEQRDYQSTQSEHREGHVFHSLRLLRDWLNRPTLG